MHKQLKEDVAKAKADVEKTEKSLADAKNVITSKDCEVSTLKEQVQCVLAHCCNLDRTPRGRPPRTGGCIRK
jgi:hypothetical protein